MEGLTAKEVPALREQWGYNEIPVVRERPWSLYLKNFWGPLPWLMELLVVVSFASGQAIEGAVIAALLFINSGINALQHRSTEAALATLSKHLTVYARARRDGAWGEIPARELLPGDLIRLRGGDVVPADAVVTDGALSVDLSALTGESQPRDIGASEQVFSGSVIRRGEATAQVVQIGASTMYGKTTELLETSHPPTHMERVIFGIVKFGFVLNIALALIVTAFGLAVHAPGSDIVDFVIVLLLTSVPIAFPTMFAVAQSYGALELSRDKDRKVLVRRLAAVQECATVDVLCSDKTGTLTLNRLEVAEVTRYGEATEARVLSFAAACADDADQDPIDEAILKLAQERGAETLERTNFVPFNSQTKRTEADVKDGVAAHVVMGLPELLLSPEVGFVEEAKHDVLRLSNAGLRVVAVLAQEPGGRRACAGLIGLADPLRPDAAAMIGELRTLGLRVIMITGDGRTTAAAVAATLGLAGAVATPADLRADPGIATRASVFAETYPEDKLTIIRALQSAGHAVAMTGDGVNDAPSLHQAEVGIAVSSATDVAKQSASFILTGEGLEGVVAAVKGSRAVFSRLRTWALNKIVKAIEVSLFTTVLFFITRSYIFSPILAVLLIFANDFLTVAIATDRAAPMAKPGKWKIAHLALGAAILAIPPLLALAGAYLLGQRLGYPLPVMRSVVYITLVWCGIGTLYAVRAWPYAWRLLPSTTLAAASIFSFFFSLAVAGTGILVPEVPAVMLGAVFALSLCSFLLANLIKSTPLLQRLVLAG